MDERLPWVDFIAGYDRPLTLFFYVDPPHYGTSATMATAVRSEVEAIANRAASIQQRIVLSLNDHPVVCWFSADLTFREKDVRYTLAGSGDGPSDHLRRI